MIENMEYIEGETPLDPDELEGLRFPHVTMRRELNELEQASIDDGMLWLRRQRRIDVLSDEFCRRLHEKLFGQVWRWGGRYRRTEKNIGVDPIYIGVELRGLFDDARYLVQNGTYQPLEAGVRFHHRLVSIHPFPNGNGRHARIMSDLLLRKLYHTDPIDWAGGQDLQRSNERRYQYIAALRAADGKDYGPLFRFAGIIDR